MTAKSKGKRVSVFNVFFHLKKRDKCLRASIPIHVHERLRAFVGAACLLLTGCSDSTPPPSKERMERLATEVHVQIGGRTLSLPLVALPHYAFRGVSFSLDRDKDKQNKVSEVDRLLAHTSNNPLTLNQISVEVRHYGSTGEDLRYREMCPLFSREWERSVCSTEWSALSLALHSPFSIIDLSKLDTSAEDWRECTKGIRASADRLPKANGDIVVLCQIDQSHVDRPIRRLAVMRIDGALGTSWTVLDYKNGLESIEEATKREGRAMRYFINYALGPHEDFSKLHALTCKMRRPGSFKNASFDDCRR